MKDKTKFLITTLFIIVIILAGVIIYAFVIKPAINGFVSKARGEGYQYAFYQIMSELVKCKEVPLVFGNTTINVIAVECLTQQSASPSLEANNS